MDNAINCARKGDLKFFKEALLDILLNARDSYDGDTVLSMVVKHKHLDCCEVICKRCPSLLYHQTRQEGSTPLHLSAYSGYLGILQLLINACDKADQEGDRAGKQKTLTLLTSYGDNAMHKAVQGGQPESIKLLIEADLNKELLRAGDRINNTPLHLAVGQKSDPVIARLLIKADPDYHYGTNYLGKTPLLLAIDKAAENNDREMLKLIMELQPAQSMVSVNKYGWKALHYCVPKKFVDTIGYIIQSCPESSKVPDNEGQNFFHHAVNFGNVEMVKHILGMKEITSTVLNSQDNLGRTPSDVAAESRNVRMVLCLHEDTRVTKNLNWVVEKHNFVLMKIFLETHDDFLKNIDLEVIQNSLDENGDTILFKAAQENHLLLCKALYKRCHSLIYHQSRDGQTALHHAAWKGEPEMLEFLIAADAQSYSEKLSQKMLLTMLDEQGHNALHKAVLNHKLEAAKLLVEADPNKELLRAGDLKNNTALHLVVGLKSDHEIARLLIKADPDFPYGANLDGKTPLLIAIEYAEWQHDREMLKLILELQPSQSMVRVNENGWTSLHYCVSNNFFDTIGYIIQSCPESSKVADNECRNFFHHAVNLGNVKMVKHILGMKEIPSTVLNSPDNLGRTPWDVAAVSQNESTILCLHEDPRLTKNYNWVVEKHNFVMMKMLMETNTNLLMNIESGVFQNSVDEDGDTILSKATQENHLFLCKELYKRCPSLIYHQSKDGRTALHHAAWKGEPEMLKFLIAPGANSYNELLTMVDKRGQTALHKAVLNNKLEAVKLLLEADPNNKLLRAGDKRNNTPLHFAAEVKSDLEIARLLIKADPDFLYGANLDGKTPLLIAIENAEWQHDREMLKLILELQPSQSMVSVNENGWTALHYSVSKKFVNTIEYIIQSCPESSKVVDNEGRDFFHHAVNLGNVEMVTELCKRCPSLIYHRSKDGRTALHHAAWKGEPEMLKSLISAAANSYNEYAEDDIESGGGEKNPQKMLLTMLDDQGDTALHRAVLNHKLEAVKLLVEADPDYKYGANTSGETPIMISVREAQSNENKLEAEKIRKLLFQMQPSQTMAHSGENGWTLLHQATSEGDLSIIEDIIKFCTGYLDVVDNEGKNFLHIAAKLEKVEVVSQVLREKDVPFNVLNDQDNKGNTPLHIAATTGNKRLTECFLYDKRVIKTTTNKNGQHVLHAINFSYDKWKAGVFGIIVDQSDLKDQREFDLVVVALIATVSFTAGIIVPGGYYNSGGPNQGTAVLSKEVSFAAFIISNTFALIFSLYAVFCHFCVRRLREEAHIVYLLNVAKDCTLAAMFCMMVAFIAGSFAVLANSNWLAIVVCIISCLFFIFACGPLRMIASQQRKRNDSDSTASNASTASHHKRN